ncbi:hypothetical protein AVEN_226817-1 [Araneus ventricosus]|uniref:CCHC-type domain-containing protein n=1 Tax=Araneus ventricosus TaxID=182803 RepID=A0A4Y2V544_ARAVE|nr:hypothetical protein AVEN_226817-1 [Araneus ventricosus]
MELERIDEVEDNFQIMKPSLKDPSIVIFNVTDELSNEFIENLKSQNEDLANAALKVRTSYTSRYGKNWIISMNPEAFNAFKKRQKVILNWTRLSFKENFRIIQCFKCAKYGHMAASCRDEEYKTGGGICLQVLRVIERRNVKQNQSVQTVLSII